MTWSHTCTAYQSLPPARYVDLTTAALSAGCASAPGSSCHACMLLIHLTGLQQAGKGRHSATVLTCSCGKPLAASVQAAAQLLPAGFVVHRHTHSVCYAASCDTLGVQWLFMLLFIPLKCSQPLLYEYRHTVLKHPLPNPTHCLQPRERNPADDADLKLMEQMRPKIISGEPFTERKSTFQVCCSTTNLVAVSHVYAVGHCVACLP